MIDQTTRRSFFLPLHTTMSDPIKNVALLGADGTLGPSVLEQLLAAGTFSVTVLKRQGSTQPDNYPDGVKVSQIPDDMDVSALTETLRGQDALVVTIKGSQTEVQHKLAQACVQAGVRRMIPADFGSVDSSSEWTQSLVPLYKHKTALRQKLVGMAEEHPGFSWTSLVCGHFFDWDPYFLHRESLLVDTFESDDSDFKQSTRKNESWRSSTTAKPNGPRARSPRLAAPRPAFCRIPSRRGIRWSTSSPSS